MSKELFRYVIRFHLLRGLNYKKWKIYDRRTKEVLFVDPAEVTIRMFDCKLANNVNTAKIIFNGANKRVCAFVEAKAVSIYPVKSFAHMEYDRLTNIRYNPRMSIHWNSDQCDNLDNTRYPSLISNSNKLYNDSIGE